MSQILAIPRLAPGTLSAFVAELRRIPDDLRIPPPPRGRPVFRARRVPRWRDALRWSLIGLTAGWAAGEVALAVL